MEISSHPAFSNSGVFSGHSFPRSIRAFVTGSAAIGGMAVLTTVGADVRVPLDPVPITLQTLFVLLAGALIGPGRGSLSQMVYVSLGAAGVPLFAGTAAGLAVLSGPTGGYLLGFVLAPLIVGRLIGDRPDFHWKLLVFAIGALTILILGTLHLALFYTGDLWTAVRVGLLPFIPGDIAKVLSAASICSAWNRLQPPPAFRRSRP